jgi:hypothetical protein
MKRLSKFKTFESKVEYLSTEDIKEIFIEVFDLGYIAKFYSNGSNTLGNYGKYHFDLKKESQNSFGWIDAGSTWGCTDLQSMSKEMTNLFTILDDIKERLNSMSYTVGFEPEFSFAESSMFSINCHIQHSSHDEDEVED